MFMKRGRIETTIVNDTGQTSALCLQQIPHNIKLHIWQQDMSRIYLFMKFQNLNVQIYIFGSILRPC